MQRPARQPRNTPKHGQTYAASTFDLFVCALTHLHVVASVGFMPEMYMYFCTLIESKAHD